MTVEETKARARAEKIHLIQEILMFQTPSSDSKYTFYTQEQLEKKTLAQLREIYEKL